MDEHNSSLFHYEEYNNLDFNFNIRNFNIKQQPINLDVNEIQLYTDAIDFLKYNKVNKGQNELLHSYLLYTSRKNVDFLEEGQNSLNELLTTNISALQITPLKNVLRK